MKHSRFMMIYTLVAIITIIAGVFTATCYAEVDTEAMSTASIASIAEEEAFVDEGERLDLTASFSSSHADSTWVLVSDPAEIEVGREYIIVSGYGALVNEAATIQTPGDSNANGPKDTTEGMAVKPVTIESGSITSEVTSDMIWAFGAGSSTVAANSGLGNGVGYHLVNTAPGAGAGTNPLRRLSSANAQYAPMHTDDTSADANGGQRSVFVYDLDDPAGAVSLYLWSGNNQWNFAMIGKPEGFAWQAPTAAASSAATLIGLLRNSPLFLYERSGPPQRSIIATAGYNGSIEPSSASGIVWVDEGGDMTFTFTPEFGYEVGEVIVNDKIVAVTGNGYTFENVSENGQTIHVTFKPVATAHETPFVVYNDVFSIGNVTTAVVIDLGEGKAANLTDLSGVGFTVAAKNTRLFYPNTILFDGKQEISRIYVNDKPEPLGYINPAPGSNDLVESTPTSGRYIVIEFKFWDEKGITNGSKTWGQLSAAEDENKYTGVLNYRINTDRKIKLSDGSEIISAFVQDKVVSPVLDRFEAQRTNPGGSGDMTILVSIDESWKTKGPLPLFIYSHGRAREGLGDDLFAPLQTSNGAAMLVKYQLENPGMYNAHSIATRSHTNSDANNVALMNYVKALAEQGMVDPDRVYISGYSMGGSYAADFYKRYPEFFAAIVPISGGAMPTQQQLDANPAIADVAIWAHQHIDDTGAPPGTNLKTYFTGTGLGASDLFKKANATIIKNGSNGKTPVTANFPFFGFEWSNPHDAEPQVFGGFLGEAETEVRYGPCQVEYANKNIFDWMFDQTKFISVTEPVVLDSIAVTTMPAKTVYTEGEALDLSGLVVTATYSDGSANIITDYATNPLNGTELNIVGAQEITVSYAEDDINKITSITVTVNAKPFLPEQTDFEFLQERAADILRNGLSKDNLRLEGKILTLIIDGREFILSANANNRNIKGKIDLSDGYYLVFELNGNGSNVKAFEIMQK